MTTITDAFFRLGRVEPIARVAGDGPDVVLAALALAKRGATLRDAKRALEAACAGTESVADLPLP